MNLKLSTLLTNLLITTFSQANMPLVKSINVPAADILNAARTINPQTGPAYFEKGKLECGVIHQEFPPYKVNSYCNIIIRGVSAEVKSSERIITKLQKIKPMTGPAYSFEANFLTSSVSQEIPPYGASQSASIIIGAKINAKSITESKLVIDKYIGPSSQVSGELECTQISFEVPPYQVESKCSIIVDDETEDLRSPLSIINQLKELKPMRGPSYKFSTKFTVSSFEQNLPPYKKMKSISVQLYK